jgi:hypothetical protein
MLYHLQSTVRSMPTIEKRIQITPSPTVGPLLRELSELTGQPLGTMIRELLDQAAPTLRETVETLRAVKAASKKGEAEAIAARFASRMVSQSRELLDGLEAEQQQLPLSSSTYRKPGRKPGKSKGKGARSSG